MKADKIWYSTLFKILLITLFLISLVLFLKPLLLDYYPDFSSYYYGPWTILHHNNPYLGGKGYFTPYVYPPFVLLFFFPFILFPFVIAEKIYTVISIVSIFVSITFLFRLFKINVLSTIGVILLILLFNFFPEKFTLGMGQINNIILLFVISFVYCYIKKKKYLAGFFLAIAILLKLTPIIFLVYLLFDKQWKILLSLVVTLAIMTGIVIIVVPAPITLHYLKIVLPGLMSSWKGDYYNQALSGFLVRGIASLSLREVLRTILAVSIFLSGLFAVWKYGRRSDTSRLLSISLLMTISLIINTFSWQHHFVWLFLPFLVIFDYLRSHRFSLKHYIPLGISYLLISINLKVPSVVPVLFQSHVFYGALILYFMNIYLLVINRSQTLKKVSF